MPSLPVPNKTTPKSTLSRDLLSDEFGEKYAKWTEEGVFSCSTCHRQLYDSEDKLKPTYRRPSFHHSRPDALEYTDDYSFGLPRLLITCAKCHSLVGHVYNRGTKAERHAVYSSSLTFSAESGAGSDEGGTESTGGAESSSSDDDDDAYEGEDETADEPDKHFWGKVGLLFGTVAVAVVIKAVLQK